MAFFFLRGPLLFLSLFVVHCCSRSLANSQPRNDVVQDESQVDKFLNGFRETPINNPISNGEPAKAVRGVVESNAKRASGSSLEETSPIASGHWITVTVACAVGGLLIAMIIGFIIYRYQKKKETKEEYPEYGVTGPKINAAAAGDRKLAQSAQMCHYQHQKQQMIAMEKAGSGEFKPANEDEDSEGENEEGDYTVYECPGLASANGELEVKNPLFQGRESSRDTGEEEE